MSLLLVHGMEGGGGGREGTGGQETVAADDAATSARSRAASSCVDAFYYLDIIPCNFSKRIFFFFIQVDCVRWI